MPPLFFSNGVLALRSRAEEGLLHGDWFLIDSAFSSPAHNALGHGRRDSLSSL